MKDQLSIQRITMLHPKVQADFTEFIDECEIKTGLVFRIVQGFRSFDEQAKIYAQGRTTPGKIVTWAPPGMSWHCYGLAIDLVPFKPDKSDLDWNYDFQHIALLAEEYLIGWGGDFPKGKKDYDHFEMTFGKTIQDAYHKLITKDFVSGSTVYINI